MTAPLRQRRLGVEQRRALNLLASSPFGVAEAIMLVHGFTRRTLADLLRAGLAIAQHKSVGADSQLVGRIKITEAGRRVIDRLTARRPSPRLP